MTSEPDPARDAHVTADAPRPTVALPEGVLGHEVLAALERSDVVVERVSADVVGSVRAALGRIDGDVVVLRRRQLQPADLAYLRERADDAELPAIVVLSEGETEAERAELLAAGAAHVLDARRPPEELARALDTVTNALGGAEEDGREPDPSLADFLSRSPFVQRFLDLVRRVADSDASLLITGETGVGKEHLARAIHAESSRWEGPFVAVNCAALPDTLLESELFGHEKGAFTGADQARAGKFELAQGGTIFLDEIGETPQHVQVKLLNVLQRREAQRLGAAGPVALDVRVMAATNRDVEEEVRAGRFREDLYYRLNVVQVRVPALRERVEDVPDLVGYLIRRFRRAMDGATATSISAEALAALLRYPWPGNVRELINVVERAMLLTDGERIELEALPPRVVAGGSAAAAAATAQTAQAPAPELPADWREQTLKEVREAAVARAERAYLDRLLTETCGHVGRTAERAGISPRALYDRLRRHGLDKDDYKDAED
ncbi:MAG: sigma-54-dependent Fis family transcriptional regulator [Planctomycetes bacterium]|nr:sigma-54-dependent Fis family transcriptional regulator [Planctomycetota bacterium]